LEDGAAKKVFLKETIEKEVRLSYLERIQRTLPEEYFSVFPEKPDVEKWSSIAGIFFLGDTDVERFGGDDASEKLIDAIRGRDESAVSTYMDENPSGELLVAGILYVSHETPYSHLIPPSIVDLVKKHTTPSSLIGTIMSFWKERPSTGIVLVMKYVDLEVISLLDVVTWLLEQDSWMKKSWGWEIIQACSEKVDSPKKSEAKPSTTQENTTQDNSEKEKVEIEAEDTMQVDTAATTNGTGNSERREIYAQIVAGILSCYERQGEQDQYWLKEWFAMVVRTFSADVAGMEGTGWAGEMLTNAEEYRKRFL